jgi:predicted small secreted protein
MKLKTLLAAGAAALLALTLTGCGDTWSGLKKDTGDNVEAAGEAIEEAGRKVKE